MVPPDWVGLLPPCISILLLKCEQVGTGDSPSHLGSLRRSVSRGVARFCRSSKVRTVGRGRKPASCRVATSWSRGDRTLPRSGRSAKLKRNIRRLGEEAVGGERRQLLVLGIGCGEDHDRQGLPARLLPNPHQDVPAVQGGESQIQQDEVGPGHSTVPPFAPQKRERLHTIT